MDVKFGHIPGTRVGQIFKDRRALKDAGIHAVSRSADAVTIEWHILFPSPPHQLITFIMSLVSGVSKGEGESPPRPRQRREPALRQTQVDEEEDDQR